MKLAQSASWSMLNISAPCARGTKQMERTAHPWLYHPAIDLVYPDANGDAVIAGIDQWTHDLLRDSPSQHPSHAHVIPQTRTFPTADEVIPTDYLFSPALG